MTFLFTVHFRYQSGGFFPNPGGICGIQDTLLKSCALPGGQKTRCGPPTPHPSMDWLSAGVAWSSTVAEITPGTLHPLPSWPKNASTVGGIVKPVGKHPA